MCVFDISLIQVLHCCYSFSRNWKIKKSCWARFSNYLKYYNQGPGILTVLLSASCTSNTKVIRELALSVSLTLLRLRPKLHQKKEICSILKWFSQTFWLLSFFFFSFLQFVLFLCHKKSLSLLWRDFSYPMPSLLSVSLTLFLPFFSHGTQFGLFSNKSELLLCSDFICGLKNKVH